MSANSEIILSSQTHNGNDTVQTLTGEKFKGDGFYSRADGIHTVQYNLINFAGTIEIQATLATNPTDADWFTVPDATLISLTNNSNNSDGSFIKNFVGNYVWVRVNVKNWTSGSISSILLNH